jgi:hypothetical protein
VSPVLLTLLLAGEVAAGVTVLEEEGTYSTILVMPLEARGVEEDAAVLLDGRLRSVLERRDGLKTYNPEDVQRAVDLSAEQAAVDGTCDTTSCLSELAGALGAELVLYGRVGKLGDTYLLQLDLFESAAGRSVRRIERQASALDGILDMVEPATFELIPPSELRRRADEKRPPGEAGSMLRGTGGALAIAGGAALVLGGAAALTADWALGKDSGVDRDGRQLALDAGIPLVVTAAVGAGVALVGGGLWWVGQ